MGRLYWKIATAFLLVLVLFGGVTLYISIDTAKKYAEEVNQQLNYELAEHTTHTVAPFINNGVIDKEGLGDIMHSMMVINPSVEVYALDKQGNILSYVAPDKVVKLEKVSLEPFENFFDNPKKQVIKGDDPRNPGEQKIFSVSPMYEEGELSGYIYIVLASQEYVSTASVVLDSYILRLSTLSILLMFIIAASVGLVAMYFITKKLKKINSGMQEFKAGDLTKRIEVNSNDELDQVAMTFNEMAETIQQNIEEIKGVEKLRKELIGNVSHDLRTPIASIQGYAETLEMKAENITIDERRKYLNIIVKSCERLKSLVNDLFELSKLESSQVKLNMEPFSISEMVQDVVNKYRIMAQKKGITLHTIISKNTPLVTADVSMIDRVLQNLIDNAIRFCDEGDSIHIEIDTENPGNVMVSVIDTGKGMTKAELENIFDRYYRGRNEENATQGNGLGLAIVKKIIDIHNGSISVSSQLNQGTRFTFGLQVV
ncbi:MAG: HAMP domain-containing histidine kinase [Schleiferiaceae bacterium]|jgi:signal transduction histidine kinase|nr:HAMP domain-containing histidine kinase [Schleiferiaceae bacterium]